MKLRTILISATGITAVAATLHAASVPDGPPVFSNPLAITNSYNPFVPGRIKHFRTQQGHTDAEALDVYLHTTRTFAWSGTMVPCRILEEHAFEDGELVEISRNYFAQADDGTVYYFGEVVDNYEDGSIANHDGSWLVGGPTAPSDPAEVANAPDPAVFMPGNPEVGDVFKPEDLFPFVDESDEVVKVGRTVRVPAGHFRNCIEIRETTMLSDSVETKWYAPGVGVVKVKERAEILVLDEIIDA
jgi:hypothetical protein